MFSQIIGNNCRFYPCCSSYAKSVLKKFSLLKAIFLIIKRLSKCHPWNAGGIDEIPHN